MTESPPFWGSILAVALVSGLTGFYISQLFSIKSSLTVSPTPDDLPPPKSTDTPTSSDVPSPSNATSPSRGSDAYKSSAIEHEEHKLVLVVRTDLGMTKGKIAAQCGHATLACYKQALESSTASTTSSSSSPLSSSSPSSASRPSRALKRWEDHGQAKIALKVTNEEDMLLLHATALSLGLTAEVIHDAGRTQIAAGSTTVLGIGPGPKSLIDRVTGHLSLL